MCIEVIKNGEIAYSRSYLSAALSERSWLQLGFESSSEVFTPDQVDNPRPFRIWRGTLRVRGAQVLNLIPVGLDNRVLDWIEAEEPSVFRFDILSLPEGCVQHQNSRLQHFAEAINVYEYGQTCTDGSEVNFL